jgi:hypothetical protein
MANSYGSTVYPQEWETSLQIRLNHPTNWKEVARVIYTDMRVVNVPYLTTATEPAFTTGTRGVAYIPTDFTLTDDTLTISTYKYVSQFIDRADLAQFKMFQAAEAGELQGRKLAEGMEAAMLADFASWTAFGDTGGGVLGLSSNAITVSPTNIDDIVRGIKREIVKANGLALASQNGTFIIWRPQDFEMLEQFAQSNGFVTADSYLKNGIGGFGRGFRYMDVDHYQSNDFTASHIMAGVKGLYTIGILKSTYGKVNVNEDPAISGSSGNYGPLSGINVFSRLDYGLLTPTHYKPVIFNINVV